MEGQWLAAVGDTEAASSEGCAWVEYEGAQEKLWDRLRLSAYLVFGPFA